MSFWKSLVKIAAPIIGTMIGGPFGGMIGGMIGGAAHGGGLKGALLGGLGGYFLPGLMQSAGGLLGGFGAQAANALGSTGSGILSGAGAGAAVEEGLLDLPFHEMLSGGGGELASSIATTTPVAGSVLPTGAELAPAARLNNPSAFQIDEMGATAPQTAGQAVGQIGAAAPGLAGASEAPLAAPSLMPEGAVAQTPFMQSGGFAAGTGAGPYDMSPSFEGFDGTPGGFSPDVPYASGNPFDEAYNRFLDSPIGQAMKTGGKYLGKAEPYMRIYGGLQGLAQANRLRQLSKLPSSDVTKLPGYEAGLDAVRRSMAAQGFAGSGNMATAMLRYGGDAYDKAVQQRILASQAGAGPAYGTASSLALLSSGLRGAFG